MNKIHNTAKISLLRIISGKTAKTRNKYVLFFPRKISRCEKMCNTLCNILAHLF